MKVYVFIILLIGLVFAVSACGGFNPISNPTQTIPAAASATPTTALLNDQLPPAPTPVDLTRTDVSTIKRYPGATSACADLTDGDLASIFAAEVNQPLYGAGPAERVIFAPERVSTLESYCIYLSFHMSGSAKGHTYQTTLWVDKPDQASPEAWAQLWTDAKSKAAQTVSGIGDDAFYNQGDLTFRKGTTYLTVEVIIVPANTDPQAAMAEQLQIEKRVALKVLGRLD